MLKYNQIFKAMKKYWPILLIMTAISQLISFGMIFIFSQSYWLGIILYLITIPLIFGIDCFIFNIILYKKINPLVFLISYRKSHKVFAAYLVQSLYLFLWCLIPIVGVYFAIYKAISYSYINYILIHSDFYFSAEEAISQSKLLTKRQHLDIIKVYIPYLILIIIEISIILFYWNSSFFHFLERYITNGLYPHDLERLMSDFPYRIYYIFTFIAIIPITFCKVGHILLYKNNFDKTNFIKSAIQEEYDWLRNRNIEENI